MKIEPIPALVNATIRFSAATAGCLVLLAISATTAFALAQTNYVSVLGAHVPPFASWSDAATNIQEAIDAAVDGNVVLVSNGVYGSGGARAPGQQLINRVMVAKRVAVRSIAGPDATSIEGQQYPPVRGVYLANGAELEGFVVEYGNTAPTNDWAADGMGGGVYIGVGI